MSEEKKNIEQINNIDFSKKWHLIVLAIIYGTLALIYIGLRLFI